MRWPARLLVVFAVVGCAVLPAPASAASARAGTESPEQRVVALINQARAQHGLAPVRLVAGLGVAARRHSEDMLARDYFSHETKGTGETFDRRIRRRAKAHLLGETIAWGSGSYGTPAGIVGMWLRSPPHRAIILDRGFSRVGVGVATGTFQGAGGAAVWTADFASAR